MVSSPVLTRSLMQRPWLIAHVLQQRQCLEHGTYPSRRKTPSKLSTNDKLRRADDLGKWLALEALVQLDRPKHSTHGLLRRRPGLLAIDPAMVTVVDFSTIIALGAVIGKVQRLEPVFGVAE